MWTLLIQQKEKKTNKRATLNIIDCNGNGKIIYQTIVYVCLTFSFD